MLRIEDKSYILQIIKVNHINIQMYIFFIQ